MDVRKRLNRAFEAFAEASRLERNLEKDKDAETEARLGDIYQKYCESVKLFLDVGSKYTHDQKAKALIVSKTKEIMKKAETYKDKLREFRAKRSSGDVGILPKAPGINGDDDDAGDEVTPGDLTSRLRRLKGDEDGETPSESSLVERFDRLKGKDPKNAQRERDAIAMERKRWLAGLGRSRSKKSATVEQEAALLRQITDQMRLDNRERDDVGTTPGPLAPSTESSNGGASISDSVERAAMDVFDPSSIAFGASTDDEDDEESDADEVGRRTTRKGDLTQDVRSLIAQARREMLASRRSNSETGNPTRSSEEGAPRTKRASKATGPERREDSNVEESLARNEMSKTDGIDRGEIATLRSLVDRGVITETEFRVALTAKRAAATAAASSDAAATVSENANSEETKSPNGTSDSRDDDASDPLAFLLPPAPTDEPILEGAKRMTSSDKDTIREETEEFKELVTFLRRIGLEHLYGTLSTRGNAKSVLDLDDLYEDEYEEMGISRGDYRRIRGALRVYEW